MLDDAIITAIGNLNNVLKEKYKRKSDRIFFLILMFAIILVPIFAFEHWVGRIAGLVLVSLFFATMVFKNREQ